jgi:hypothetical protein
VEGRRREKTEGRRRRVLREPGRGWCRATVESRTTSARGKGSRKTFGRSGEQCTGFRMRCRASAWAPLLSKGCGTRDANAFLQK